MTTLRGLAVLVGLLQWAATDPAARAHRRFVAGYDDPFGHEARLHQTGALS